MQRPTEFVRASSNDWPAAFCVYKGVLADPAPWERPSRIPGTGQAGRNWLFFKKDALSQLPRSHLHTAHRHTALIIIHGARPGVWCFPPGVSRLPTRCT